MKKITVKPLEVQPHEYSVTIGSDLLRETRSLIDLSSYSQIAIVTDSNVNTHFNTLKKGLNLRILEIILEPGEKNKNVKNVEKIWKKLAESGFDRQSLVINLGGGVICDIGGFAASTFMRGIDFINVPTTLLSQVDASVGGKTGIDFASLKNLIGTFQQPKAVIIDVDTLTTLPKREFLSGFAEVIKHGLIKDKNYFQMVTAKNPLDFSEDELIEIIGGSCEIKKRVVQEDPTEKGSRKILNFGHTIGHAVESLSLETKSPITHGEAISIGMVAEAKISQLQGPLRADDLDLVEKSLTNAGLPTKTDLNPSLVIEKITKDKKNSFGEIKWTLLNKIGEAVYDQNVAANIVLESIGYIKK